VLGAPSVLFRLPVAGGPPPHSSSPPPHGRGSVIALIILRTPEGANADRGK
jgi:hypothetical protein